MRHEQPPPPPPQRRLPASLLPRLLQVPMRAQQKHQLPWVTWLTGRLNSRLISKSLALKAARRMKRKQKTRHRRSQRSVWMHTWQATKPSPGPVPHLSPAAAVPSTISTRPMTGSGISQRRSGSRVTMGTMPRPLGITMRASGTSTSKGGTAQQATSMPKTTTTTASTATGTTRITVAVRQLKKAAGAGAVRNGWTMMQLPTPAWARATPMPRQAVSMTGMSWNRCSSVIRRSIGERGSTGKAGRMVGQKALLAVRSQAR
mmetsp:Transcript_15856/g.47714  ORF Transcript_15856/g.47714 Transcript_15856/m.47714 type:complete len:260 (+) Transcript_15856:1256-2035(+)